MREATRDELAGWDGLVDGAPGGHSFWQLTEFAEMKQPTWQPRFVVHATSAGDVPALYLVRRLPWFGEYWYAPNGPRVADVAQLREVVEDLRQHCPGFAVNLEPPLPASGPESKADVCRQVPGLRPIPDIQLGAHTVVIDLRPPEEELLASFKQRTRRSLRKADKDGAVVEHLDDESAMEPFWELHTTMAERAGITLRDKDYYLHSWRTWLAAGKGHFVLARPAAGEPYAAGAFLWVDGRHALYKDGGSLRIPAANGLQYTVQWEAMRWAKERGCVDYDMFGMPPSWQLDDESHRMHGLVQFKTGFGGVSDTIGAVQLVRAPRMNTLWDRLGRRAFNGLSRIRPTSFY